MRGLAHYSGAYALQVKATKGTTQSLYSETILIIDTPIKSANGHSPGSDGQAEVGWSPISAFVHSGYDGGATTLRVRKIGDYTDMASNTSYPHTSPQWRPEGAAIESPTPFPADGANPHTITGLMKRELYAIQYTTSRLPQQQKHFLLTYPRKYLPPAISMSGPRPAGLATKSWQAWG